MKIGYARVSTGDQNLAGQMDALVKAGCHEDHIYSEQISSAKAKRPELEQAIRACRAGDTLVFADLTRLGRDMKELIELVGRLREKGVQFESLNERIDTNGALGEFVFHLFAALAQLERARLIERTNIGLAAAKARGRTGGRPPKLSTQQIKRAKRLLADPGTSYRDVARDFGINASTLWKSIKRFDEMRGNDVPA